MSMSKKTQVGTEGWSADRTKGYSLRSVSALKLNPVFDEGEGIDIAQEIDCLPGVPIGAYRNPASSQFGASIKALLCPVAGSRLGAVSADPVCHGRQPCPRCDKASARRCWIF